MTRKLRLFAVSDLLPPENHALDESVVKLIAESLLSEGLREPLVVVMHKGAPHILHGVHRWAAARLAGVQDLECVIDSTVDDPLKHEARVLVENLHRQHLDRGQYNATINRLVEIRVEAKKLQKTKIVKKLNDSPEPRPAGLVKQQPTPRREAIREVAEELGKTEKVVERAVDKAEAKKREAEQETAAPAVLDVRGATVPAHLVERWSKHKSLTAEIGGKIRAVNTLIGKLHDLTGRELWTNILSDSKRVWGRVKGQEPSAVCHVCKGIEAAVPGCESCNASGMLSTAAQMGAPPEMFVI